ncbi:MAG: protein kinase [Sedimentisphaerales bacterium]|nr:protein kinase [Sedimentisphaerales bacterium]
MADKPNDIETIYDVARQKPAGAERSAYLDKACGNDAALRARVEALLKANEDAGSFLESPPFEATITMDKARAVEKPGDSIGPYKLLEKIGEGGMAYVYMAEQERPLRRRVALKIIKLGMDTRQVIARFEAERQALAVMDHPNIAKVFDAGATETGRPYFVMELVKGVSVTEYCDKNNLSTPERLDLFIQVCNAVQHAHQKGIIHRDIKPSNVMVTLHDGKPVPKVIDFGIAKATIQRLTEKTLFTKYAQMIGTPEYMSPEQAEMSGLDIDTRADIYSLGILLYELLTGTTPFAAEDLRSKGYGEMQRIIRETEPLKPSTKLSTMGDALTGVAEHRKTNPNLLAKLVRGDLDWIVMKTLEKDRTRRYETVSSLAVDVKRHLNEEPVEAGPPGATYRIGKFIRKHRRTVAAVLAIAATLIIGLIVSTTLYFIADHARNQEAVARATAEHAEKTASEKAESLRRANYVNSIQLADAKYKEGNIGRVRHLLDSSPEDLRGWEWNRINHVMDQSAKTLRGHEGAIYSIALHPDGKQVASGALDGMIKLWDLEAGTELATLRGHTNPVYSIAYSPDGKLVASGGSDRTIRIWDIPKGDEVTTLHGSQKGWNLAVAFSPDGNRLASGGNDEKIRIWDLSKGEEVITLGGQQGKILSIAFSPDGKQIASGADDQMVTIWDTTSGEKATVLRGHNESVTSVKFSPDGKYIASGSWDRTVRVWNASTGAELKALRGHTKVVASVAYDPSGKYIVSSSLDNTIKLWDAKTGEELSTLRGHCGSVQAVLFSLDGKMVISGSRDKTIKVWDISACDKQITAQIESPYVSSIAFSPDGKRVASVDMGEVKILDIETGAEVMTISGHKADAYRLAYAPDGKRIVTGSPGGMVTIWDAVTGTQLMARRLHDGRISCLAFSPDGGHIASAGQDKTIRIWDASTGVELMQLSGHKDWTVSIAYSPDGTRIVSGGRDGTIKLWNAETGAELITFSGHEGAGSAWQVAFSPDGKRIVSCCDVIKVWDAETGGILMTLSEPAERVLLSPDGKRLFSNSLHGDISVWDSATGGELMTLEVPIDGTYSSALSPDGRTIAVGGIGGIVLWETTKPAGGYGPRKNSDAARKIIDEMYQKHGYYYEVIDRLQTDKTLDEPVRKVALQIANSRKWEDADKLNGESWEVVSSSDGDPNAYKEALNKAEKAISLDPNDLNILNTLGVAQYRVGDYEKGLETLTRCENNRADDHLEPAPENVAFIAMSLHKLGRTEEAKAALERLRALCKEERFAEDQEAQAFLAEAEKLIEGKE